MMWLLGGLLGTVIINYIIAVKVGEFIINPLMISLSILGILAGGMTLFGAVIGIIAFIISHEPLVAWFNKPLKRYSIKKDKE